MAEYLLGIDIGTSACKAAVFDTDGNVKASGTGDYPVFYPHQGWAEQNPEDWYRGVCAALKKIWDSGAVRPEEIAGIGIDGQGWSAIALDREGKCLANTPIWMDTRAQEICDRLNSRIGEERIFNLAGNPLQPSYTTPKVLWYREMLPEVFEKTEKILHANGYIGYRLTGAITEDICDAYGWHCFNMRTGKWDTDMAKEMGIPVNFLPEILNCDQVIGTVTAAAAKETGLPEGIPVVAGGLDAACGTLGAGVIHQGETQEQGGQAGGMSICLKDYKADPRLILSFHVVPGNMAPAGRNDRRGRSHALV
jgi:xylulokinase